MPADKLSLPARVPQCVSFDSWRDFLKAFWPGALITSVCLIWQPSLWWLLVGAPFIIAAALALIGETVGQLSVLRLHRSLRRQSQKIRDEN